MSKARSITQDQLEAINGMYFVESMKNDGEWPNHVTEHLTEKFNEEYDHDHEPSRYAKQLAGWTKNELLLVAFNQWLGFEEAFGEQAFGLTAKDSIGERSRFDLLKAFHSYLGGWIEGIDEGLEEDETISESSVEY